MLNKLAYISNLCKAKLSELNRSFGRYR